MAESIGYKLVFKGIQKVGEEIKSCESKKEMKKKLIQIEKGFVLLDKIENNPEKPVIKDGRFYGKVKGSGAKIPTAIYMTVHNLLSQFATVRSCEVREELLEKYPELDYTDGTLTTYVSNALIGMLKIGEIVNVGHGEYELKKGGGKLLQDYIKEDWKVLNEVIGDGDVE